MSGHDKLREAIDFAEPEIDRAMECLDPVLWTGRDGPKIHAGYLKTIIAAAKATLPADPVMDMHSPTTAMVVAGQAAWFDATEQGFALSNRIRLVWAAMEKERKF